MLREHVSNDGAKSGHDKVASPTMDCRNSVTGERQQGKSQQQQKGQGCRLVYSITPMQELVRRWQIMTLYEVMTSLTPFPWNWRSPVSGNVEREKERERGYQEKKEEGREEEGMEGRAEGGRGRTIRKGGERRY